MSNPSSPHFKAVLFDMDGVLADTSDHIVLAASHALRTVGLPAISHVQYAPYAGAPLSELYANVASGHSMDDLVSAHRSFQQDHPELIRPFEGTAETLEALRARGVRLAVVTGTRRVRAENVLEGVKLKSYFECIVTTDDTTEYKPKPAPYLEAAKRLSVLPEECLAVEDGAGGLESANAAGMKTVRALYGFAAIQAPPFKPDYEIHSIKEVLRLVR